jgi:hypothetical protein
VRVVVLGQALNRTGMPPLNSLVEDNICVTSLRLGGFKHNSYCVAVTALSPCLTRGNVCRLKSSCAISELRLPRSQALHSISNVIGFSMGAGHTYLASRIAYEESQHRIRRWSSPFPDPRIDHCVPLRRPFDPVVLAAPQCDPPCHLVR